MCNKYGIICRIYEQKSDHAGSKWANFMNRQRTEEMQMVGKHMKRWSTSQLLLFSVALWQITPKFSDETTIVSHQELCSLKIWTCHNEDSLCLGSPLERLKSWGLVASGSIFTHMSVGWHWQKLELATGHLCILSSGLGFFLTWWLDSKIERPRRTRHNSYHFLWLPSEVS